MNDRFLRACRREPVDATPVWFMRQAGRYMADYRALRTRYSLLEICRQPELAVAVTMQPVDVIEVDAAILFSDLLVPFTPLGLHFDFVKGEGPSIERPIRHAADVDRLRAFDPRVELAHVMETIRLLRHELADKVPLIGFAGAPFTLAAYAIEGGPSTSYAQTKTFMYAQPKAWHRLCERLAATVADFLMAQIEAGAQALQIFDSWAGALNRADYREFALPHSQAIFDRIKGRGVPLIHFGVGATNILTDIAEAGGDVIGLDWREPLDEGWARVPGRAIQGNLDPARLLGPVDRMLDGARDVLAAAGGRPGHIFNLGHGIQPPTPLEHVQELARFVHRETQTDARR